MHIRRDDTVEVRTGDDKGVRAKVLRVDPKKGRAIVEGVNRVYKHLRPSRKHPRGGRMQKEMPIGISNVLPVDPKANRPTRVAFRLNTDGSKDRIAKKSGQILGTLRKAR
jgi:large subunit ribosomal protein L24